MPRNQKTQESRPIQPKNDLKKKIIPIALAILVLTAAIVTIKKINNMVEKETINNYVCQIVASDVDANVMGMRCMVK